VTTLVEQAKALDIIEVAARVGVNPRKHGWACCPIHGEKTPSFHLRRKGNGFYCFGCEAGGDTIELVMLVLGLQFKDTLEWFATNYGLKEDESQIYRPKNLHRRDDRWDVARKLAEPRKKSTGFELPWETYRPYIGVTQYVLGRGISRSTAAARQLGHDPETLRSLWPIIDHQGALRGVSGRLYAKGCLRCGYRPPDASGVLGAGVMKPKAVCPDCDYEQPSKWLHTNGFEREFYLYGEDQIDPGCDYAILVEGLGDRDMLWQYGFLNVLATMGTAISKTHIDKTSAWFKRLIVFGDGDDGGRKMTAAWKTMSPLPVYDIATPEREDPGSLGYEKCSEILAPAI
jgi:DNA primase